VLRFLKRARAAVARPVLKVLVRLFGGDPWERFEHKVPLQLFGAGATKPFETYFADTSTATVQSLDEICNWLLDCVYVSDPEQFGQADYWQHPAEFESRRRGDCDDHALWAWRKLNEIGVPAEFVVGRSTGQDGQFGGHAWVHFTSDGREYLLEAAATSRSAMVHELSDPTIRKEYQPHFAVDAAFRRHAYWGYLCHLAKS
jgi:hypothetical protein